MIELHDRGQCDGDGRAVRDAQVAADAGADDGDPRHGSPGRVAAVGVENMTGIEIRRFGREEQQRPGKVEGYGGVIRLRVTRLNGSIQFEVLDSGCGIPPEKMEAIFQPFVQAENGLTRTRDGVGAHARPRAVPGGTVGGRIGNAR